MGQSPDFSQKTKDTLAKRAGQMCSNPDCPRLTSAPHTQQDKALNLGEAAHIAAARQGEARYDPSMTDKQRSNISNGIWLCRECARRVDLDEEKYTVEMLRSWKAEHEACVSSGRLPARTAREILVRNGGIGSIIQNTRDGTALDLHHDGSGPAERITVEGSGVGEITINTGKGTAKRITSTGGGTASESRVVVDRPVNAAAGMVAKLAIIACEKCGHTFAASKVVQAFAGDGEPRRTVECPHCGAPVRI